MKIADSCARDPSIRIHPDRAPRRHRHHRHPGSLPMPALANAKARANSIKCLNNLRQVELALVMYAGDHDSYYPPDGSIPTPG